MLLRILVSICSSVLFVVFAIAEPSTSTERENDINMSSSAGSTATVKPLLEKSAIFDVKALFSVDMEKQVSTEAVSYHVTVSALMDEVDTATAAVVAHVKDSLGGSKLHILTAETQLANKVVWTLNIPASKHARFSIKLRANAKTLEGSRVSGALPTQFFTYPAEGDPIFYAVDDEVMKLREELAEKLEETPEQSNGSLDGVEGGEEAGSVVNVSMVKPEGTVNENATDEDDGEASSGSWLMIIVSMLGVIVASAAGFFGYQIFKKRKENGLENAEEDTPDDSDKSGATSTEESTPTEDAEGASDNASDTIEISDDDLMADLEAAFNIDSVDEPEVESAEEADASENSDDTLEK